jgi:hypothetical protein
MAYDPQDSILAEKHHQTSQLKGEIKRLRSLLVELEKVDEEKVRVDNYPGLALC